MTKRIVAFILYASAVSSRFTSVESFQATPSTSGQYRQTTKEFSIQKARSASSNGNNRRALVLTLLHREQYRSSRSNRSRITQLASSDDDADEPIDVSVDDRLNRVRLSRAVGIE